MKSHFNGTSYWGILGNIYQLKKILNINVTKKSGKKPHSYSNPYMMGFPDYALLKFKNILKKYGYVVFVIDQEDIPGSDKKKRVLRKIFHQVLISKI